MWAQTTLGSTSRGNASHSPCVFGQVMTSLSRCPSMKWDRGSLLLGLWWEVNDIMCAQCFTVLESHGHLIPQRSFQFPKVRFFIGGGGAETVISKNCAQVSGHSLLFNRKPATIFVTLQSGRLQNPPKTNRRKLWSKYR